MCGASLVSPEQSCLWCVDSGVGSNVGPSYGSSNLDAVEEADIEAGQILTALKSSPSPIRSVLSIQLFCTSRTHIYIYHRSSTLHYIHYIALHDRYTILC